MPSAAQFNSVILVHSKQSTTSGPSIHSKNLQGELPPYLLSSPGNPSQPPVLTTCAERSYSDDGSMTLALAQNFLWECLALKTTMVFFLSSRVGVHEERVFTIITSLAWGSGSVILQHLRHGSSYRKLRGLCIPTAAHYPSQGS